MALGPFRKISDSGPAVKRRLSDRAAFVWGLIWAVLCSVVLVGFWIAAVPVNEPIWTIIVLAGSVAAAMLAIAVARVDATLVLGPAPAVLFVAAQSTDWAEALAVWSTAILIALLIRIRHWADSAETMAYLVGAAMVSLAALHWFQSIGLAWPISAVLFVTVYMASRLAISLIRLLVVTDLSFKGVWELMLVWRVVLAWAGISVAAVLGEALRLLIGHVSPNIGTYWGGAVLIILFGMAAAAAAVYQESRTITSQLSGTLAAANALPWSADTDIQTHALHFARLALPDYSIEIKSQGGRNVNEIVASLGDGYLAAQRGSSQRPFLVQDQHVLAAIAHISVSMAATRREQELLTKSATTDDLTGLANYRGFREALAVTAEAEEAGFALVYVDVDHFKEVNDVHGHEVGNAVLRTLATRLRLRCAPTDLVARVGGDEFVLIMTGVADEGEAAQRADELLAGVSGPIVLGDTVIALSLSSGLAFAQSGDADLTSLMEVADERMYAERGRQLHGDAAAAPEPRAAQEVVDLVDTIEAAIHERRLAVMYQPIVDAVEDRIVGFEALIRPNEPALSGVPAEVLVHEAQRLGLLTELSIHVIDTAVNDLLALQKIEPALDRVNVNIDVEQVTDPVFLDAMTQARDTCGVGLALELSETSLNRSSADLYRELNRLRTESNVMIALDDFGRRSSTLLSLLQYPTDILKIDRALITDIHLPKQQMVIRSMATLAQNLEVSMVVEGVEDQRTCDELTRIGVRYMQGHHFGGAVSVDDAMARLRDHGLRATL